MSYMAHNEYPINRMGDAWSGYPEEHIRRLHRELFNIWIFLAQEGILEEAKEYMEEHREEPTPFEDVMSCNPYAKMY